MTLSSSVGTAGARAALPAGALELDLQDKKKKKRKTEKKPPQPSRSLIDISATPTPPRLSSALLFNLRHSLSVSPGGKRFIRMLYL